MWFIDIDYEVYDLTDEQNDGDKNGMSSVSDYPGKLFLIDISYKNWMRYEVNCSIYWQTLCLI